ncbi:MAG: DNA alkylation repair protein [Saprospiraceae bacterium]|nr:DNA alkylation repair protein [Saprospiraceae bacterium]
MSKDFNNACLEEFRKCFKALRNSSKAIGMKAYMRNQFDFCGVQAQDRRHAVKAIVTHFEWDDQNDFIEFIRLCWQQDQREYKYLALDLSRRFIHKLDTKCIPFFEQLIITDSWWDTVDGIAPQIIGRLIQNDKARIQEQASKWIQDDNIWNQRSALILQLFYKEKTDFELLTDCILRTSKSKEFFIEKAAGWALRQYSKTNPERVKIFLAENKIPSLSFREGMKYILQKAL